MPPVQSPRGIRLDQLGSAYVALAHLSPPFVLIGYTQSSSRSGASSRSSSSRRARATPLGAPPCTSSSRAPRARQTTRWPRRRRWAAGRRWRNGRNRLRRLGRTSLRSLTRTRSSSARQTSMKAPQNCTYIHSTQVHAPFMMASFSTHGPPLYPGVYVCGPPQTTRWRPRSGRRASQRRSPMVVVKDEISEKEGDC
jgi:hypothetical protein